jgi:hypothetical protein
MMGTWYWRRSLTRDGFPDRLARWRGVDFVVLPCMWAFALPVSRSVLAQSRCPW